MTGPNEAYAAALIDAATKAVSDEGTVRQSAAFTVALLVMVRSQAKAIDALAERLAEIDGIEVAAPTTAELRLSALEFANAWRDF